MGGRRGGANKPESNKDQEPTVEATEEAVTEEVKEEAVEETPKEETEEIASEEEPEVPEDHYPEEDKIAEEESAIQASPPLPGAEKGLAVEADPKLHVAKKKMYRIIIDQQDNTDRNNDAFVTDPSNGVPYNIKRGFEVDVPEGVVNNLRESVMERLEYDENGEEKWRRIPRYAMRVIKELS